MSGYRIMAGGLHSVPGPGLGPPLISPPWLMLRAKRIKLMQSRLHSVCISFRVRTVMPADRVVLPSNAWQHVPPTRSRGRVVTDADSLTRLEEVPRGNDSQPPPRP